MNIYCRLCGSIDSKFILEAKNIHGRHLLSEDRFPVYMCKTCETIFLDVEADGVYYKKYYPHDYYRKETSEGLLDRFIKWIKLMSFRRRLKLIEKYGKFLKSEGVRFLEIGCGEGDFLEFMPTRYQKTACEINPVACENIKNDLAGIALIDKKIEEAFSSDSRAMFDCVGFWSVFEHINNPDVFILTLKKILAPNGFLIFDIPNPKSIGFLITKSYWFHLDAPRHLFFYSKKSLEKILKKHDLKIVYFGANEIEYFQDLAVSLCQKYKTKSRFLNVVALICFIPIGIFLRFLLALFVPSRSEINTYIVTHA